MGSQVTKSIRGLLGAFACTAVVTAPAAEPGDTSAAGDELSEVVVTGSRIARDGFQAPTPLTVMNAEDIAAAGVKNIAEFVQEIPAVAGSWDLNSRSRFPAGATGGGTGLAVPALRNLGTTRTLVLLDGQRTVPSVETGEVDTSNFPQQLISRVDVVTGGASAAYGSDAVSGVINFILDKKFTGLKSEVSGGISDYGDNENGQLQISGGIPFAGGRGHLLVSGELYRSEGIFGNRDGSPPKREWLYNPDVLFENPAYTPTNGLPFYINLPNAANSNAIKGALINGGVVNGVAVTNVPVRGVAFGEGGAVFQLNYGTVVRGTMSGGDWQLSEVSGQSTLDPIMDRQGIFSRLSWGLTDNVEIFGQFSSNHTYTQSAFCCFLATNIPINVADNPFLPASVRARAQAANITTLNVGSYLDDARLNAQVDRWVNRYIAGVEGRTAAFGSDWSWNGYVQYGKSKEDGLQAEQYVTPLWNLAIDAVSDPVTGAAICRVKLTNPTHPCQPYNPLGWGVVSDAGRAYVGISRTDGAWRKVSYEQTVYALSASGEPFSLWAGPVSIGFGAEHRSEEAAGIADPYSQNFQWGNFNFAPTVGKISVTEGFLETIVPLANDKSWARALEFNGAVRQTSYSEAGSVTTWKAGLTWQLIDDLRLRATRSRDIRAPNITETFAVGSPLSLVLNDPFTGTVGVRYADITQGNPNLKPEKADTTGLGIVYQPSWVPGLSASVDYYNIEINDAIAIPAGGQEIVDRCFAGEAVFCTTITRGPDGQIQFIYRTSLNFVQQLNRGVDFELGYGMPFVGGNLNIRAMATRYLKAFTDDGVTIPRNRVGEDAIRDWRYRLAFTYSNEPFTFNLSARGANAGVRNTIWIECNSGCPTSTIDRRTLQEGINGVPGFIYFDTGLTYAFDVRGAQTEAFLSVRNLFDRDPPRISGTAAQGTRGNRGTNDVVYDLVGRMYRAGVRFRF